MFERSSMPPELPFPEEALTQTMMAMPVRVLVAEDDPSIQLLLKEFLVSENYDIVTASDGAAAWTVLQDTENPPRLAILDWMMPRVNGLALCRRIKERNAPFVFTIMLTDKNDNHDILAGLRAGADEFLDKPFDLDVLKRRVAAGARIVRLENLLTMKNAILAYYVDKVEKLADERARLLAERDVPSS